MKYNKQSLEDYTYRFATILGDDYETVRDKAERYRSEGYTPEEAAADLGVCLNGRW